MKEAVLHHPLAEIRIKLVGAHHLAPLKAHLLDALDEYSENDFVTVDELRNQMKEIYGDHFETPGYYLRIFRKRADLTQVAFAKKLNIKQHHLSEMENNKRSIGKSLAKKFAAILNCDYRKFL